MLQSIESLRLVFQELANLGPAGVLMHASESRLILFLEERLQVLFLLVGLGFVTMGCVLFGGDVAWLPFAS